MAHDKIFRIPRRQKQGFLRVPVTDKLKDLIAASVEKECRRQAQQLQYYFCFATILYLIFS